MTLQELRERQQWTLEQKIDHSLGTIEAFVNRMGGIDKVYVSFSGGKDSTVLFHLARRIRGSAGTWKERGCSCTVIN